MTVIATDGLDPVALAACWAEDTITVDERDALLGWVRSRVAAYRDGARSVGWETEPSAEDFAEWIGLDLGRPFEFDHALTERLLDAAEAVRG